MKNRNGVQSAKHQTVRSIRQSLSGRVSRRAFLGKGGLLLAGLGLLSGRGQSVAATAPAPKPVKAIDLLPWKELRGQLTGGLLRPGESGYAAAAAPWNARYASLLPAAIARCQSAHDVQVALLWAQDNRLPISIRSGGHSMAGYSSTRGLMLDLSAMRGVSHDPESGLVTIEGGARVEDVLECLAETGSAVTLGRCPNLGLGGLILGGGLGLAMRHHGLTCDQLRETEMVTSEGLLKTCSREQNEDLFWACRGGGGGNFGVHTSFTLKTFPVRDVVAFRMRWSKDLADVLPTLLSMFGEAGDELGCQVNVTARWGRPLELEVLGQYLGEQQELTDLLGPATAIVAPDEQSLQTLPYYDAQEQLAEQGAREICQVRSRYTYAELPPQATDLILEQLSRWPGSGGEARWKGYLMGGAVDRVPRRSTAYVHRGATLLTAAEVSWKANDPEPRIKANLAWLDALHAAVQPFTSQESYQSFSDPAEKDYAQAYYGENLTYLTTLKRRLDAKRTFVYDQSVPFDRDA